VYSWVYFEKILRSHFHLKYRSHPNTNVYESLRSLWKLNDIFETKSLKQIQSFANLSEEKDFELVVFGRWVMPTHYRSAVSGQADVTASEGIPDVAVAGPSVNLAQKPSRNCRWNQWPWARELYSWSPAPGGKFQYQKLSTITIHESSFSNDNNSTSPSLALELKILYYN